MGAVYEVEQVSTGTLRALKLMHPDLAEEEAFRKRFDQEARIGARIESDHVVHVVGAGIDPETGCPWIAMELLKGKDLEAHLRERGALPRPEINEIFGQLCHALAAAHAIGLVHRDLKPANIFVASSRRKGSPFTVKVLDFGVAKLVRQSTMPSVTRAIGTPLYMAPEQTRDSRDIGPHTDVWALGLLAFRMMTGQNYYLCANGSRLSPGKWLDEVRTLPLAPASVRAGEFGCADRIAPGFDGWFSGCVCRDLSKRFKDAGVAGARLEEVLAAACSARVDAEQPT